MYTPKHVEWLDRTPKDSRGWPAFMTEEAKEWCRKMIRRGFERFGPTLSLDTVQRCIFDDYVRTREDGPRPECLRLGLWDAIYGVCHRAMLDVGATDVWVMKENPVGPLIEAARKVIQSRNGSNPEATRQAHDAAVNELHDALKLIFG